MKNPTFKDTVDQRIQKAKDGEQAPTDTVRLENGDSSIEVRTRGAFITECKLMSFSTEPKAVELLYCDPEISASKLTASHMMTPVGPSEGIGGQHGIARWVDWHVFENPTDAPLSQNPRIVMQAKRGDLGESLFRTLELGKDELIIHSEIQSNVEEDTKVSLGEHLYFPCKEGDIEKIRLYMDYSEDESVSLAEAFGQDIADGILEGEPYYWSGFNGHVDVDFGDDEALVEIDSDLDIGDDTAPIQMVGMLIWHKPGTDSICFEPVAGFYKMPDGTLRNDELRLSPMDSVAMRTSIRPRT